MPANISDTFVHAARHTLVEGIRKIEHCLGQLTDEQLWWRPKPEMNGIANLLLHLAGNIRQWIVSGVGGATDVRNRPAEFADRSNRTKSELLATLKSAVRDADQVLAQINAEQLTVMRRIQGYDVTALHAAFDCISHFRGHVQEIIHMTRTQLGEVYKFDFVPKGKEQESAAQ